MDHTFAERLDYKMLQDWVLEKSPIDQALANLVEGETRSGERNLAIGLIGFTGRLRDVRLTKRFSGLSRREALDEFCKLSGLNYGVNDWHVAVVPKGQDPSKIQPRLGPKRQDESKEAGYHVFLGRMMFSGVPCDEAIAAIDSQAKKHNVTGKPIRVELRLKARTDPPVVYAWWSVLPVADAVELVCLSSGLHYSSPQAGVYIIEE